MLYMEDAYKASTVCLFVHGQCWDLKKLFSDSEDDETVTEGSSSFSGS